MTSLTCPYCASISRVPDIFVEMDVRCQSCEAAFRLPLVSAQERPSSAEISESGPILRSLLEFAADRGNPRFPCLSRRYSPTSRVPCADFSPWLCEKIRAGDIEAVIEFIWQIVEGNPGVSSGNAIYALREHWKENAKRVLDFPLQSFLDCGSAQAYVELRAALFLLLPHDNFGGFALASDAPKYLAKVMIPHCFRPTGVDQLVQKANKFIRAMRKDTPFWHSVPIFRLRSVRAWASPRPPSVESFLAVLGSLSLGTRAHFFDATRPSWPASGKQALCSATSYSTRKRGLDADESAIRLLESGLLERSTDVRGFLMGLRHKDLSEILEYARMECRESGGKGAIADFLIRNCPALVTDMEKQVVIGEIAAKYRDATVWAHDEVERTTSFFQLWLGFAASVKQAENRA
jgi:hypothetical protein